MVGTPVETGSPRFKLGTTTPPLSARGLSSARGMRPLASARGSRSAPGTPRPTQDSVQVYIRMRPPRLDQDVARYSIDRHPGLQTPRSLEAQLPPTPRGTGTTAGTVALTITGSAEGGGGGVEEHRTYEFADVFEPTQEMSLLHAVVPPVVEQLRNGFNAAVLCYGQTGSGKTFSMQQLTSALVDTMFGVHHHSGGGGGGGGTNGGSTAAASTAPALSTSMPSSNGTTPSELFSGTHALIDSANDIVEISYVQIYGTRSYDLLMTNNAAKGAAQSEQRRAGAADPLGEPMPKPKGFLISEPFIMIHSSQELYQRVNEAQKRRVISPHALNASSSRSHTLLSIRITKCVDGTPVQSVRVTLADLAGSERVKKSGVAGESLDEAIAINKSLSVLHAVIKASSDPDSTAVVPLRESLLTLYLAPVLTNSCLFLVATISLEQSNFHETKSTLEFATIAKRCVITRTKSMDIADRLRTNGGQAVELQLQQEIEALRQKVGLLQEELDIERQKRELLAQEGGRSSVNRYLPIPPPALPGGGPSVASPATALSPQERLLRDHIQHLEQKFASLQSLLRDREAEKLLVVSRKSLVDDMRRELDLREQEREEARLALMQLVQQQQDRGGAPIGKKSTQEMLAALEKVCESFLWLEEEYQKAVECNEIHEKSLSALRSEYVASQQALLDARRRALKLESERAEAEDLVSELTSNLQSVTLKFQTLECQYYREKQERITTDEVNALHTAANFRHAELEKVRAAFDEQRALMESLQTRLTEMERQLEASEIFRMKLAEENRARQESMCLAWSLFTPQQRGRYLSSDPLASFGSLGTQPLVPSSTAVSASANSAMVTTQTSASTASPSVFQGYDNIQLRSTVRDLQKQLQDAKSQLETRAYRIEDLEEEVRTLSERIRNRDDEYATLVRLDGQHVEQNEEMQHQIADLFTYIDAHNARQEQLEARWRETQTQIEKLEEERRASQSHIQELSNKLDDALEQLRSRDQDKDMLTARLREAVAEKNSIARMRADDQARVAELERELERQQKYSNEVSRKLDTAMTRRHHLAAEMTHHALQSEVLQTKLVRTNGEEARKRIAQLKKGVDQGRVLLVQAGTAALPPRGDPAALAEMMQRNNHSAQLRFEVTQLFRQQHSQKIHDYDTVSLESAAGLPANYHPTQGPLAGKAPHHHRDPATMTQGYAHRAPPPPLQLANLRSQSHTAAHPPQSVASVPPAAVNAPGMQFDGVPHNPPPHSAMAPNAAISSLSHPHFAYPGVAGGGIRRGSVGAAVGLVRPVPIGTRVPPDIPPLSQIKIGHGSPAPVVSTSTVAATSVCSNPAGGTPPQGSTSSTTLTSQPPLYTVVPSSTPDHSLPSPRQRPVVPKLTFKKGLAAK